MNLSALFKLNFFDILDHARDESVKVGLTTDGAELGRKLGRRLVCVTFCPV